MGIVKYIQNKPDKTKIKIVWSVTIAVLILLIATWVATKQLFKLNGNREQKNSIEDIGHRWDNLKEDWTKEFNSK